MILLAFFLAALNWGGWNLYNYFIVQPRANKQQDLERKSIETLKKRLGRLKEIALGIQSYYHVNERCFPPHAIYSNGGKPLLSWRVLILPYIGEQNLYDQFHLNESWDSEHNKKLLDRMPRAYAAVWNRGANPENTTPYQGFIGLNTFFTPGRSGSRLADFPDGLSYTIMIVESSREVPWSKPEDILYDARKPLPQLGPQGSPYFCVSMCDGWVRSIDRRISETTLRDAITCNDGRPLGADF